MKKMSNANRSLPQGAFSTNPVARRLVRKASKGVRSRGNNNSYSNNPVGERKVASKGVPATKGYGTFPIRQPKVKSLEDEYTRAVQRRRLRRSQ